MEAFNLVKNEYRTRLTRWAPRIGAAGLAVLLMTIVPQMSEGQSPDLRPGIGLQVVSSGGPAITQDEQSAGDTEVPSAQVEKYVAVYKAMQRDRTLTASQAAAKQGMTLQEFRNLESRIQRDDSALQHARDELQSAAKASTGPASQPTAPAPAR